MPTQLEYELSKQNVRLTSVKMNLLNSNFQVVGDLTGDLIDFPSFTIDSTSDIRRTCSVKLTPTDSSFDIAMGNKIWLDKYIQIYIGQEDVRTKRVEFTNMGIYTLDNPQRIYSLTENSLTIKGLDLMAKLTGLRNGNLEGMAYVIPQGSNVRQAMISILEQSGINSYVIEECETDVPNDININVGGTVYNVLTSLRDIVPNYQIYFDVDGVFHYDKIPSGKDEQVMVDDDIWKVNLLDYQKTTDFESLKNSIEVFGKTHDITNYSDSTLDNSNQAYLVTLSEKTSLIDNIKIGFTTPSQASNYTKLKVNLKEGFIIGTIVGMSGSLLADTYYVVKYNATNNNFTFMGEVTPYAKVEETNPDSPFYVEGTVGRIRIVLSGGEYDNIYTSDLAKQRAEWELYTRCRLLDNVSINCIPIYWLDVNWLVELTLPNKYGTQTTDKYLIKSINIGSGANNTQSITLMKYYSYYDE